MDHAVVTAFAGNVAVLLAVCAVWNTAGFWTRKHRCLQPILSGLMLAGLCLIAINTPLILPSGMLLDTRSILVSVTALLFGPVPTAIVAVTAVTFELGNGGVDTLSGLVVILTSALIGLAWRRWAYPKATKRYWVNLLMMSVTVQAAALASTVLIPYPQGMAVFRALALPMLLVFPTATVILSQLLIHTQAYRIPYGRLERFEPQRTQGYECSQQLLQQMPDAFALQEISFDKHGQPLDCRFLSVNAAFEKMVGLGNADILGKTARDVLPDVVPAWLITCGNVVLTGEPAQLEYCAFATSQHYGISVYRTSPSQCAATFSNITNRVRAAEETSKSLLRLQSLINYSPSPIVIMDDKGRIMELSAAARRILGMPPDDRVKQEATRLAPPEIFKKVLYVLSQPKDAAPSLESIDVFEFDGGKRYFESRLFPIHAPSQDEKLFGYLAIDVTERIEVEHALKASEEKYSNYIKNAPYQDRLELLATLHDIGKVGISDYILTKPGKLSIEEWAEMKRHPEIGYRIAISTPELIPVAESILCHHERWDGGGYPQGLMGEKIPLLARILAIVDAYDAMTHDRPYQKAIPSAEAIAEIALKAGTQFDPQLVRIILDQKVAIALKAK